MRGRGLKAPTQDAPKADDAKTRVFVSYSRFDGPFVETLVSALADRGYDVLIDRTEIAKGEVWWGRIVDLIIESDLVVFVASPSSLGSPVCGREIQHTTGMGKRIVPILFRAAPGIPIPPQIAERDWVDMTELGLSYAPVADALHQLETRKANSASVSEIAPAQAAVNEALAEFERRRSAWAALPDKLNELVNAIELDDVIWRRAQAKWLERAVAWDREQRPSGKLLRSGDILGMRSWISRRPPAAPSVPAVVSDYLDSSIAAETAARRRIWTLLLALAVLVSGALGAGAYNLWDRYDRGLLVADADPQTATIEVDRVQVGARIRNYTLRTGVHELTATAPDHLEARRTVQIGRGQTSTMRFYLESAIAWPSIVSPNIQNGGVLFQSGGEWILAHNELGRIVFVSTATGEERGSIGTPAGTMSAFEELDFGAGVDNLIVSAVDYGAAGSEVIAISESLPIRPLWRWRGQPSATEADSLGVAAVRWPEPRVAVVGRDGVLRLLDAASGEESGAVRISAAHERRPAVYAADSETAPVVAVCCWVDAPGGSLVAAGVNTQSLSIIWRREFEGTWNGPSGSFLLDAATHLAFWNEAQWRVIKLSDGSIVSEGRLRGPLHGAPKYVRGAEGRGPLLLVQYQDPDLGLEAIQVMGGATVWRAPLRLSSTFQPDVAMQTSDGLVLTNLEDDLVALDPVDGGVAWRLGETVDGILVGDWDGDGDNEIFVTTLDDRMICLDGAGRALWALRLQNADATPWRLVPSAHGGATQDVLIHKHAGLIGLVHGPRRLWQENANSLLRAGPLIGLAAGAPVVVGTGDWGGHTNLRAFDAATGARLWSAAEELFVNRPVAIGDLSGAGVQEVVAIGRPPGANAPHLLAYQMADGARTLAVPLPFSGWYSATPIIANYRDGGARDVAFNTWEDHSILMVDGRTGEAVWRYETPGPNMGGMSASDLDGDGLADVLAQSSDGFLYALHGVDGRLLWRIELEPGGGLQGDGLSAPVVAQLGGDADASVVAVSALGRLYVINARTGEVRWRSSFAGGYGVCGSPVVVTMNQRQIILAPQSGAGLVAYDVASQQMIWRVPAAQLSTPLVIPAPGGNGAVAAFAVAAGGTAYLFDLSDGSVLWNERIGSGGAEADPAMADINGDGVPEIVVAVGSELVVLNGLGNFGRLPRAVR